MTALGRVRMLEGGHQRPGPWHLPRSQGTNRTTSRQVFFESRASVNVNSFRDQPPDFPTAVAWTSPVLSQGRGVRSRAGVNFGEPFNLEGENKPRVFSEPLGRSHGSSSSCPGQGRATCTQVTHRRQQTASYLLSCPGNLGSFIVP